MALDMGGTGRMDGERLFEIPLCGRLAFLLCIIVSDPRLLPFSLSIRRNCLRYEAFDYPTELLECNGREVVRMLCSLEFLCYSILQMSCAS